MFVVPFDYIYDIFLRFAERGVVFLLRENIRYIFATNLSKSKM